MASTGIPQKYLFMCSNWDVTLPCKANIKAQRACSVDDRKSKETNQSYGLNHASKLKVIIERMWIVASEVFLAQWGNRIFMSYFSCRLKYVDSVRTRLAAFSKAVTYMSHVTLKQASRKLFEFRRTFGVFLPDIWLKLRVDCDKNSRRIWQGSLLYNRRSRIKGHKNTFCDTELINVHTYLLTLSTL